MAIQVVQKGHRRLEVGQQEAEPALHQSVSHVGVHEGQVEQQVFGVGSQEYVDQNGEDVV